MTKDEITTMRTELANKFAEAGAAFLDFTGTGSALAPIEGTTPQQYAAAGTLETIRRIWPQDEAAATVLTDERIETIVRSLFADGSFNEDDLTFARAIERAVLAHAGKAVAADEPAAAGIEGLKRHKRSDGNWNVQEFFLATDVERLFAQAGAAEKRVAELEAARIAYASEFPLTADGEPDVGNIHANIRKLKADLAQAGVTAEPVAWFEAEASARGRPAKEVIGSMLYSTRFHTKAAPITSNPVWPLYTAPTIAAQVPAAEVRAAALEQAAQACEAQNDTDWPTPLGCAKAIRALKGQSTADKACEVRAAEWISVGDERKPKARTAILVTVDYVRYGQYEDGTPGEWRTQIVTEGEYVAPDRELPGYFTSYSSPHGDGDIVTHWMPLPTPPSTADSAGTGAMGEGAEA